MHKFPTIFLFKGKSKGADRLKKSYYFDESLQLFSVDNLCSILIEYSSKTELKEFLKSSKFNKLFKEVDAAYDKKITIVDVQMNSDESAEDFLLETYKNSLNEITIKACEFTINRHLGFKFKNVNKDEQYPLASVLRKKNYNYGRFLISKEFVLNNHSKLSARFANSHSSRYVDSQVPFTMLAPCLSGTSEQKL